MSHKLEGAYENIELHFKSNLNHGHWPKWNRAIEQLARLNLEAKLIDGEVLRAKTTKKFDADFLINQFLMLKPWRKGPYAINDVKIDSEWQCQFKWKRIASLIDWRDKRVLDIGSGNGYFAIRAYLHGACEVIALDPTEVFLAQYLGFIATLAQEYRPNLHFIPATLEDWVHNSSREVFNCPLVDVALSMGVLYHRRNPQQHLREIRQSVKAKGEVIVETLIQQEHDLIIPEGARYCGMPNVHALPSIAVLKTWLEEAGYQDFEVVSQSLTTEEEQRATSWSGQFSLIDRLDSLDKSKTVEGLPAPNRAVIYAKV